MKFKEVVERMEKREHWTKTGLRGIIGLAYHMNALGKQRKYSLNEITASLAESSETIRQNSAPPVGGRGMI